MSLASRLTALAQAIAADVKALYAVLGPNPQGTASTVADRIAAVEATRLAAFARASVAGQQINDAANGGAFTAMVLTADDANNTAGMHAANSSRIVAPVAGPYALSSAVWTNTFITAGRISASLRVNGNEVALEQDNLTAQAGRALVVATSMWLNAGDYVEVFVEASNTAVNPLSIKASLSVGLQGGVKGDKGDPGDPGLLGARGAEVFRTGVMAVASGAWVGPVTFTDLRFDNINGEWDPALPTRLTCKKTGWYLVTGACPFPGGTTGRRTIAIKVNGVFVTRDDRPAINVGTDEVAITNTWPLYLIAGDYVELWLNQDSGASMNVPSFAAPYALVLGMVATAGPKGDKGDRGDPGTASGSGVIAAKTAGTFAVLQATWTALIADSVRSDNADGLWSAAAPDRLTCKRDGWYHVWGSIVWPGNASGRRMLAVSVNGTIQNTARGDRNANATDLAQSESFPVYLHAGDYVQIHIYQDSGSTLNVPSTFSVPWACEFGMVPIQGPKGDTGAGSLSDQQLAWTHLPLNGTYWQDSAAGTMVPGYAKMPNGMVLLRGVPTTKAAVTINNATYAICTLPPAYRPVAPVRFVCLTFAAGGSYGLAYVVVDTAGNVYVTVQLVGTAPTAVGSWVTLDNLSFMSGV